MSIKETLGVVIGKLTGQSVNVAAAKRQAEDTLQQADADAVAAAKVLLAKFGNPQGAVQIVQNVYQVDALKDTLGEIDAMIATLQVTVTDAASLAAANSQLVANTEVAANPLSQSGGVSGTVSLADAGASSEVATPAA